MILRILTNVFLYACHCRMSMRTVWTLVKSDLDSSSSVIVEILWTWLTMVSRHVSWFRYPFLSEKWSVSTYEIELSPSQQQILVTIKRESASPQMLYEMFTISRLQAGSTDRKKKRHNSRLEKCSFQIPAPLNPSIGPFEHFQITQNICYAFF